ncbi:MAG: radical SAM protein [bacterium]
MDKIEITLNKITKTYSVIPDPLPHILVQSHKLLHGWWQGKRECTAERLLINPYNGCSHNCFMCYTSAFNWGFFELYHKKKIITVCENFDKIIANQLNSLFIVSAGYLSPVTDPFQPINQKYCLSEKIINEFTSRNIPIEFITKNIIPSSVISMIKKQKHSFGQISILTLKEDLHKFLCPGAASVKDLLNNLKILSKENIHSVCRIDPIIPYITDNKNDLKELINISIVFGTKHIIASCLDIPLSVQKKTMSFLSNFGWGVVYDYGKLYNETIDLHLHAQLDYRRKIFSFLREECDKKNITFALCMEFKIKNNNPIGLNKEFMSSINCEGINIPIYAKDGDKFKPIAPCNGSCLVCKKPICGIEELALGKTKNKKKGWKLSDYRKWSKNFIQPTLKEIK